MKQRFLRAECLETRAMLSASLPTGPALETAQPVETHLTPENLAPAQGSLTPQVTPQPITLAGDFNGDFLVNSIDIDMLTANLGNHADSDYDLTVDGLVDKQDMDMLIRDIIGTEYGDADLDGHVGAWDAFVMFRGMMSGATGWASGDFSCDGVIDGQDFIEWNRYKFTQTGMQNALAGPAVDAQQSDPAGDHAKDDQTSSAAASRVESPITNTVHGRSPKAALSVETPTATERKVEAESVAVHQTVRQDSSITPTQSAVATDATNQIAARPHFAFRLMRFRG